MQTNTYLGQLLRHLLSTLRNHAGKNGIVGKKEVSLFTMATGTLGFITRFEASFKLCILIYIDFLNCQQFVLPFKTPSDCRANEFFDISSLSCVKCGPNQRQSTTGLDHIQQLYS